VRTIERVGKRRRVSRRVILGFGFRVWGEDILGGFGVILVLIVVFWCLRNWKRNRRCLYEVNSKLLF